MREQKKIKYHEIISLDFNVEKCHDNVYFKEFGYGYEIITKHLTKFIYLDWAKETQFCKLVRIDSDFNIKKEVPVYSLDQLNEIIDFFTDK